MRRRIRIAALLLLGMVPAGAGGALEAKVYIDIDSPGGRSLPVALVLLPPAGGTGACGLDKAGPVLLDALAQDLSLSGFFRLLPRESYMVEPEKMVLYPGEIDFRAWALIRAEALILIQLSCEGDAVTCEAQLLDVLTGKMLAWKRYRSAASGIRKLAHKFANEVEKALTGVEGAYDTKIAYVSNATGNKELCLMDFDGDGARQITAMGSIILSPSWSPDGRRVAFTSYWKGPPQIYRMDLREQAPPEALIPGFSRLCSGAAWSPDGNKIAFSASREDRTNLFTLPAKGGGKPEPITQTWSIDVSPSWSPDGKQMGFGSSRMGHPDLYIMDAGGGGVRRLTYEGSYNADPDWSPAGDWIAFVSEVAGRFQVCRIRPDGSQRTQLTHLAADHFNPSFSPNGRLIAFSSNPEGNFDLYLLRSDGSGRKRLTWSPRDETDPAWSPRLEW